MKNFEMEVKNIFYLGGNRMAFCGHCLNNDGIRLPMEATIYVNNKSVGKVKLTTIPFFAGANVRRDIDSIEASEQIDLSFINWELDRVILKSNYSE